MKLKIFIYILFWINLSFVYSNDESVYFFEEGQNYYTKQNYTKAYESFKKAISKDREYSKAYYQLSEVCRKRRLYEEGLSNIETYIILNPERSKGYYLRGLLFEDKNWWERAISEFNTAVEKDSNLTDAFFHLGKCYFQIEKLKKAEDSFNKILSIEPTNTEAQLFIAKILTKNKRYSEAVEKYKSVYKQTKDLNVLKDLYFAFSFNKGKSENEIIKDTDKYSAQKLEDYIFKGIKLVDKKDKNIKKKIKKQKKVEINNEEHKNTNEKTEDKNDSSLFSTIIIILIILIIIIIGAFLFIKNRKKIFMPNLDTADIDELKKYLIEYPENIEVLKRSAELNYNMKRYSDAAKNYVDLAMIETHDKVYCEKGIKCLLLCENFSKVNSLCDKYLKRFGKNNDNLFKIGCYYVSAGEFDIAIETFNQINGDESFFYSVEKEYEKILVIDNNNFNVHYALIDLYERYEKYDLALKQCEELINIEPMNIQLYLKAADISVLLDNSEKAFKYCNIIIEKYETNKNYYDKFLDIAIKFKSVDKIVSIFNKMYKIFNNEKEYVLEKYKNILNKFEDNGILYREISKLYIISGNYEKGVNIFEEYLGKGMDDISDHVSFLQILIDGKQYEHLISICNKIVEKDSKYIRNIVDVYKKVVVNEPKNIKILFQMAKLYPKLDKYNNSINILKNIIKLSPDIEETYILIVDLYIQQKKYNEIFEFYNLINKKNFLDTYLKEKVREIIVKENNNATLKLKILLASIYENEGNYSESLYFYEQLNNDNSYTNKILDIYDKLGEYKKSISLIQNIIKNKKATKENYLYLAKMYQKNKDYKKAISIYKNLLKTTPGDINLLYEFLDCSLYSGSIELSNKILFKITELTKKICTEEETNILREKKDIINELKIYRRKEELKALTNKKLLTKIPAKVYNKEILLDVSKEYIENTKVENIENFIFELGEFYYNSENYDDAIVEFQKIIKLKKGDEIRSNYYIGLCFMKKEFIDLAKKQFDLIDFSKLSEIDRNDIQYNIACEYQEKGLLEDSVSIFKTIISSDFSYKDVNNRIEKINDILDSRSSSSMSGRYKDLIELGKGGMGIVYKALDTKLNREVAIKVLSAEFMDDPEALARFLREARAAAALTHPNIVSVYDVEEGDMVYISMELVKGKTLKDILKEQGKINEKDMCEWAIQICSALEYAHHNGIVHRDIKPDNIMITDRDNMVKIADFGLATIETEKSFTEVGVIMGTSYYMAPEQIKGENVTKSVDVYALGASLYQLLSGNPPFSKGDITYQHVNVAAKPLKEVEPTISDEMNNIVMKCLEKTPEKRYSDDKNIIDDIKNILNK